MHDIEFSWNDFYGENSPESSFKSQKFETNNQTTSAASLHISCCSFINCKNSQGAGGGIFVSSSSKKILVEETTFSSCEATSGEGGGVYYSGEGSSIFYRVCSYQCKASSGKHFCSIKTCYNNSMIDCSVSYTNNSSQNYAVYLYEGKIYVSLINSSNNKVYRFQFSVHPRLDSFSSNCLIKHSNFACNLMEGCICVEYRGNGPAEMRTCNVIKNSQGNTYHGAVYSNVNLYVYDSCVIENNIPYSFSTDNGGDIRLYNTTFDIKKFYRHEGGGTISVCNSSLYTNRIIFLFLKTAECDAENAKLFVTTRMKMVIDAMKIIRLSSLILLSV